MPVGNAAKEYAPDALAVVVAVEVPVTVTVAPLPPVPLMVPERAKVCTTEENVTEAFAPLIVTPRFAGVIMKPAWLTATV